ncbi:hypothetical protein [Klebsiella pneumoniae]|nr:hypothetical protein [Klebsiella pneumoniae]EOY65579.1 hypothetical protein H253_5665 [Klebsiella pneumoniae KP-7]
MAEPIKPLPAAPGDGAIFPQYPIQLQLAPLGISLDMGFEGQWNENVR